MKKRRKTIIIDYDNVILLLFIGLVGVGALIQLDINSVRDNLSYFFKHIHWIILSIF